MKQAIIDRSRIPYGSRYVLELPELGFVGAGNNFYTLKESVEKYRHANGIPIGLGFEDQLEEVVCAQFPRECSLQIPSTLPAPVKVGLGDVVRGTRLMVAHKLAGSPLVSQEEANRRSAICARCPLKGEVMLPCNICRDFEEMVKGVLGVDAHTPSDGLLKRKACGICRCALGAAVWIPIDLQWGVLSEKQKEQFKVAGTEVGCWKQEPPCPPR